MARIRERSRCLVVIVLEGKDDLSVYEIWLKRISEGFKWEPMIAHGKRNLLDFLDIVRRDRTQIGICTYFITDHDYDGLRSRELGNDVYVLPSHSTENYLTGEDVFGSLLRTEMQVLGDPGLHEALMQRFRDWERDFIELMRAPCAKLFGACNEKVGNVVIDDSLGDFISIDCSGVKQRDTANLDTVVRTDHLISAFALQRGFEFLNRPDCRYWIRGKFMYYFFRCIFEMCFADRRSEHPIFFPERAYGLGQSPSAIDYRSLAGRSALPAGLRDRVRDWVERCTRACE
ncbi:MAG: DUF4435 domain-containing protein [Gammaproteobacteria bacterium]